MMKRQVVVVGAGPGGATTAYYLARAGIEVLLVDKETWPRDKVCGDGQSPIVYPILKDMGVYDEILEHSYTVKGMSFTGTDGIYSPFYGPESVDIGCLVTERRIIDDIVRRGAIRGGAEWMENFEALELVMKKGVVKGVKGLYRNREITIDADAVVIADGSHSMLARQLGIWEEDPEMVFYGARGYFENVEGMDPDVVEMFFDYPELYPSGYMWTFPMGGENKRSNVGIYISESALKRCGMRPEDMIYYWRDHTKMGNIRLKNAKLIGEIKGWRLPCAKELGRNYAAGALVVGDASNDIDDFIGGGYSEAMQGGQVAAGVLAEALKKGDVSEETLSEFHTKLSQMFDGPIYHVTTAIRDFMFTQPEDLNKCLAKLRSVPGFPHVDFTTEAIKYLTEEVGLDMQEVMAKGRAAYADRLKL